MRKPSAPIIFTVPHSELRSAHNEKRLCGIAPHNLVYRTFPESGTKRRNKNYRPVTRIYLASAVR